MRGVNKLTVKHGIWLATWNEPLKLAQLGYSGGLGGSLSGQLGRANGSVVGLDSVFGQVTVEQLGGDRRGGRLAQGAATGRVDVAIVPGGRGSFWRKCGVIAVSVGRTGRSRS
jgi:hypothetical protein